VTGEIFEDWNGNRKSISAEWNDAIVIH